MNIQWSSARPHDLPPLWDGAPVEWLGWETYTTSLQFHVPVDQLACKACGCIGRMAINVGVVDQLASLSAFRCVECRADQVWDRGPDEWWELEPDDYRDDGSVDPRASTLF